MCTFLVDLGNNDLISLCLAGVDRENCDQIDWINDVIALLYHYVLSGNCASD